MEFHAGEEGRTIPVRVEVPEPEDYAGLEESAAGEEEEQEQGLIGHLNEEEASKLMRSLPEVEEDTTEEDRGLVFGREKSLVPPQPGKAYEHVDIGTTEAYAAEAKREDQVQVVNFWPGEEKLPRAVPHLSLTFNTDMVVLGHENLSFEFLEVTPEVEGNYRWLGARTVMFEPEYRFPMSSVITCTVNAGLRSADGYAALENDLVFRFETPTLKCISCLFVGDLYGELDPRFRLKFDQDVDKQQVLQFLSIKQGTNFILDYFQGSKLDEMILDTDAEEKDADDPRVLYVKCSQAPLATENRYTLLLSKGCPSAEGPLVTPNTVELLKYETYASLKVVKVPSRVNPSASIQVQFNNQLDEDSVSKDLVEITPPLDPEHEDEYEVTAQGAWLMITGNCFGGNKHKISIAPSVRDVFGQTLAGPKVFSVTVILSQPNIVCMNNEFEIHHAFRFGDDVLESSAGGDTKHLRMVDVDEANQGLGVVFEFATVNIKSVYVVIRDPHLSDMNVRGPEFTRELNFLSPNQARTFTWKPGEKYDPGEDAGRLMFDKVVTLDNPEKEKPCRTIFDLMPFLASSASRNVRVYVSAKTAFNQEQLTSGGYWNSTLFVRSWIQLTNMNMDVFHLRMRENEKKPSVVGCYVMDAKSRMPLPGVIVSSNLSTQETDDTGFAMLEIDCWKSKSLYAMHGRREDGVVRVRTYDANISFSSGTPMLISMTDRGVYKPKEEVCIKGYVRRRVKFGNADEFFALEPVPSGFTMKCNVHDSMGAKAFDEDMEVETEGEYGAFSLRFKLPDNINLGHATANFEFFDPFTKGDIDDSAGTPKTFYHNTGFEVQEFRTPKFNGSLSLLGGGDNIREHQVLDGRVVARVEARYYNGGTVSGSPTSWTITSKNLFLSALPGWHGKGYDFGESMISFPRREYAQRRNNYVRKTHNATTSSKGTDDITLYFAPEDEEVLGTPKFVTTQIFAQCVVTDSDQQTYSSSMTLTVHPARIYVGLKWEKGFMYIPENVDEMISVRTILVDTAGEMVNGTVFIGLFKQENKDRNLIRSVQVEISDRSEVLVDLCQAEELSSGSYLIFAHTFDEEKGRRNQAGLQFQFQRNRFASTRDDTAPGSNESYTFVQGAMDLIPSSNPIKAGEVVAISINSPDIDHGRGRLFVSCNALIDTHEFELQSGAAVVEFEVLPESFPNLELVALVYSAGDEAMGFAMDSMTLNISKELKMIQPEIHIEPGLTVSPGEDISVTVNTQENQAGIEVTLFVVDQAVLDLYPRNVPDLVDEFWLRNYFDLLPICSLANVVSNRPGNETRLLRLLKPVPDYPNNRVFRGGRNQSLRQENDNASRVYYSNSPHKNMKVMAQSRGRVKRAMAYGGDALGMDDDFGENEMQVEVRSNFNPLVYFAAVEPTDENGVAGFTFPVADSLTQYSALAIVAGLDRFGKAEQKFTTKLPIQLRPTFPRFLVAGDSSTLKAIVENSTEFPLEACVVVRTNSILQLEADEPGNNLVLPPKTRVLVEYPVTTVGDTVGSAVVQLGVRVVSGDHDLGFTDAVQESFPVYRPPVEKQFALYQHIDADDPMPTLEHQLGLDLPLEQLKDKQGVFGSVEVNASSSILNTLQDAYSYVVDYPFDCCEQITSKALCVVILDEAARTISNETVFADPAEVCEATFQKLAKYQMRNGYFTWWPGLKERSYYMTVHVAHLIARALGKGIAVPTDLAEKTLKVVNGLSHTSSFTRWPVSKETKTWMLAKVAYVLSLLPRKHVDSKNMKARHAELFKIVIDKKWQDPEGIALTLSSLALYNRKTKETTNANENNIPALVARLGSFIVDTTAERSIIMTGSNDNPARRVFTLHSTTRAQAIGLEALILADPKNPQCIKLLKGLSGSQKNGRWNTTNENVYAISAFARYFEILEGEPPDFVATFWLTDSVILQQNFAGYSGDRHTTKIDLSDIPYQEKPQFPITVSNQGSQGRLYYRIGLSFFSNPLLSGNEKDYNTALERGFSVQRTYTPINDPSHCVFDGDQNVWTVKHGALIRVKLEMVARTDRYHVALVDYLPAGFEPLNPILKGTEDTSKLPDPEKQEDGSGDDFGFFPRGSWYWRPWYDHHNIRDERVEAFGSYVPAGVHEFIYVARATFPGTFLAPPCKCEEMYAPETHATTQCAKVIIS